MRPTLQCGQTQSHSFEPIKIDQSKLFEETKIHIADQIPLLTRFERESAAPNKNSLGWRRTALNVGTPCVESSGRYERSTVIEPGRVQEACFGENPSFVTLAHHLRLVATNCNERIELGDNTSAPGQTNPTNLRLLPGISP